MPTFRERLAALGDAAKGLINIYPTTTEVSTNFDMKAGGISAGRDVSAGANLAIFRPGGSSKVSAAKAMARYNGWVYTATKAIADEIANTEWRLFRIRADGDHEEQFEADLLDLLNGVNEHQTGVEFKHLMASHLELVGNAYVLLIGKDGKPVASFTETPIAMALLSPANVSIKIDKSTYPYNVAGYTFRIDGQEFSYKPEQIVHLKYPDPNDQFQGIGTVQAIPDWLDTDEFIMNSNRKTFEQGVKAGGMLTSPYKGEAQLSRLRTSFAQNYEGTNNNGKTIVLPDGVKFTEGGTTPRDMDYANLLDKMEGRILAGFRVSKTVLGAAESETNRATAETADYVFAKRTIKPKLMLITSYLNEFLVPRFGQDIYLSFDDPVPEDKSTRVTEMQGSVAQQPVMSVNEAREEYLGLGPIEGGDAVMVSTMMQELGGPEKRAASAGKAVETETKSDEEPHARAPRGRKPAAKALYFVKGGKVKTRFSQNADVRQEIAKAMAERIAKGIQEANESTEAKIKEKGLPNLTHEEYMPIWEKFVGRVGKYEKELQHAIVKISGEQREEVLKNLAAATGVEKALDPKKLFDIDSWISLTIDAVTPILSNLSKAEAIAAANLIDKPEAADVFDTPEHKAALDKSIQLMSQSYNETTLAALKTQLDEGISAGEDLFSLKDRVADVYDFSDTRRAGMIAKTESFRIANDTTKATWKSSGVVSTIKWYTAEDANVCGFCSDQDGKTISIDDNFFDQGDKLEVDGRTLDLDYSDVGAPPLHPDCRCYVRPEDISLD